MSELAGASRGTRGAMLLTVLVWAAIYLPGLGSAGFTDTEAHRAVPGFELIAKATAGTSDWLAPTMFDRVYLRKPPGMTWGVALSSWVLGPTEFSARLVSALSVLLGALTSGWYAYRWFGPRANLPGSLAVVLMPAMWLYGRTAELEAPMFVGTLLAGLGLLDLIGTDRRWGASKLIAAVGMLILLFVKGPAGLPAVTGAVIAGALVGRSTAAVRTRPVLIAAFGPLGVFGGWLLWVSRTPLGADAIIQSPTEFMWSLGALGDWLLLAPMALLAGLPMTLSLLFPWGPDAASEPLGQDERSRAMSRSLAWAALATIAIFLMAGVSNPRYALPVLVFAPPLVGWVVSGLPKMTPKRARIARWMMLGGPRFALGVLLGAGVSFALIAENEVRNESGRSIGVEIAALVPRGSTVAADHAIEARPEMLLEVVRAGSRVEWRSSSDWPMSSYLLVRSDTGSDELSAHKAARATLGRWRVHEYEVVLLSPDTLSPEG